MKFKPIVPNLFLLISCFFFSTTLLAQLQSPNSILQPLTVYMDGVKMRVPVDLQNPQTKIALCNLVPGRTYTAIAKGRSQGQTTSFSLQLSDMQIVQQYPHPYVVRFTAPQACVEMQVQTNGTQEIDPVPMYLSVKCEDCPESNAWKKQLLNATGASVLEVQSGQSAEDLIRETLIDGDCFGVENVTFDGVPGQIGTFSNGSTNIGFQNGVIIATGSIAVAPGPNFMDNASAGYGNETFDADLFNIANDDLYDRASIEFDFTPTESPISFQFVFASEEYCEYVFTQFNDVFGFFISGPGITGTKNLAVVPNTSTPVTINTINHQVNDEYYINNQGLFSSNLCGQFPSFDQAVNEVQYDGFTVPLVATTDLIPCSTYHIKLKIADVGDGVFDSAVFLKAGSFVGGGDATVDFVVNGDPDAAEVSESCGQVSLLIDRVGSDQSQPVDVSFTVTGTATPGVDYTPLDSVYTIPAGQDQLVVPITIFNDMITEGAETIVLLLNNSCSCDVTEKTLTILDNVQLADTSVTISICNSGDGVTLTAIPLGGMAPYTYQWSTNETTASIFVNPDVTTSYSVTIVDACSDTAFNYFLVQISPLAEITENVSFCPGGSIVIGDSTYTESAIVVDTLPGMNGDCDTVLTYNLTLLPLNYLNDTIAFCPGGSVTIGDSVYTQPGVVTDTLPGMNGDCDTVLTYELVLLPLNTSSDTIVFCFGDSVVIGDSTYTESGVVMDTLPGMNGDCDTIATYVLQALPQYTSNDTIAFCPGGSVTIGDSTYTEPAVVMLVLDGMNGDCDTLATYVLELQPLASITDTIAFCPGSSVTLGDSTYTEPAVVMLVLDGMNGDCDTLATYVLELLPQANFTDTIAFCPGSSVTLGDSTYTEPAVVMLVLDGMNGDCDTLATYVLELLPQANFTDTIAFCPGSSVTLGDSTYTEPAVVMLVLDGMNGDCDTLATYVLELLPQVSFSDTISFCPGNSVTLGDSTYTEPTVVTLVLDGMNSDCDTLATYVLELLPQVSFTDTIAFCPGDTIFINGNAYTNAGTINDTLSGSAGFCDTLATYVLVSLTPAPSDVKLICPDDISVTVEPAVVHYDLPDATSDCPCPGIMLELTDGLPSDSIFPPGVTKVCYMATDSCGNTATCCFEVTVPVEEPCDEATIGCIKFEMVSISEDSAGNNTYRVRVTNNCPTKLMYAAFSLPSGVTALAPPDNSVYTAPSGREYTVRNPNFTPFYSIRFKADIPGIANGESDLFEFTLPALANPLDIHSIVRIEPKKFYDTYLSTSGCDIEAEFALPGFKKLNNHQADLRIYPNPASDVLFADLSGWKGQQVQVYMLDSRGQRMQEYTLLADATPQEIQLPQGLSSGLYFLEIVCENGDKQAVRFVLQR